MRMIFAALLRLTPVALLLAAFSANLAHGESLQPGVRGVATHAPPGMKIDGNLEEFQAAFCTPVGYFDPDLGNRAAVFLYMWDDEAFYVGLKTLDKKQANPADDAHLWEGDGVEWYFDTRSGADFRSSKWGPGAAHMYWTAYKNTELRPRWCLRPDMLKIIPGTGIEVSARQTVDGAETEFKLPWANFPEFKAKTGALIALDAELCYSDGAGRVNRTFAFGSPLSVQQPASQGKVQLIDKLEPEHFKQVGPVMFPVRCDTAWTQPGDPQVTGLMAVPSTHAGIVGKIVFRVLDLEGKTLGEFPARRENFAPGFERAIAQWSNELAPPGGYSLLGIVYDQQGNELARVAPRLVSVQNTQGY